MGGNICFAVSDSWKDWDIISEYIRKLDTSVCLFLKDPMPNIDRISLIRGIETFWYVDQYPKCLTLIVQWGQRNWDYPTTVPVYDPISRKYLCHGCGTPMSEIGTSCSPDCTPGRRSTERGSDGAQSVPKSNSFQYIDQGDADKFFVNCCKTFGGEDNVFEEKKETNKFMQTMLIKIKRHDYRERKETFKKQLRTASNQSSNCTELCKALTKGGKTTCGNKAIGGTEYCGIPSHKKLAQPTAQQSPQLSPQ